MSKVLSVVQGIYASLWTPARVLKSLEFYMASAGWEIIYYNDGGPGDRALKEYGLNNISERFSAFTFANAAEKVIALNIMAHDKLRLFAHEMGHIYLGHDLMAPTPYDEVEADQFSADLLALLQQQGQASTVRQPASVMRPVFKM